MDVQLAGMNGDEVTARLKKKQFHTTHTDRHQ
jgi:CheY-like chemotaxis protein